MNGNRQVSKSKYRTSIQFAIALVITLSFTTLSNYALAQTSKFYMGHFFSAIGGSHESVYQMNLDGTGKTTILNFDGIPQHSPWFPNPSYTTHGGKRWFLTWSLYPDWPATPVEICFVSDANETYTYPLEHALDNSDQTGPMYWVPGDAEISFTSTSSVNGQSGIWAIPIVWDANGYPSIGASYLKMPYAHSFDQFSWNPTGTAVVFSSSVPSSGLYTLDLAGSLRRIFSACADCVWGPTNKICARPDANSLRVMNADGTGNIQVYKGTTKQSIGNSSPWGMFSLEWSPDGSKVAFHQKTVSGKLASYGVYTVPSSGGAAVLIPGTTDGNDDLAGWP